MDIEGSRQDSGRSPRGWSEFSDDLASSARALRKAPLLIVLTLLLWTSLAVARPLGVVAFIPLQIAIAGFVGTQRMWFARLFRGEELRRDEIWPLTLSYIGRFVGLGLSVAVASIPLVFVILSLSGGHHRGAAIITGLVYGLTVDLVLTFVVPALALTTTSPQLAWRVGIQMIKQTWPRSAWYVLTPGITLTALTVLLPPRGFALGIAALVSMATSVVALVFKGAIVAFYLRQPVPSQ
jgi:hypothetical protein